MAKLAPIDLRLLTQGEPDPSTSDRLGTSGTSAAREAPQEDRDRATTRHGLHDLASKSPRLVDDDLSRIRRDKRTIMSFNNMPVTIKKRFDDEARRRKMGKKELFIEMMRHFGIDVPSYDLLDGRRQY